MNAPILLKGYLTEKTLGAAWRELKEYLKHSREGPLSLTLVLDSEGGETAAARAFVKEIEAAACPVSAKIYRAESAAAFIALSAETREIVRGGVFRITLGGSYLDSNILLTKERVPALVIAELKQWRAAVFSVLKRRGFPQNGELKDRLLAHNELTFSPEQCLELGLVQRII